MPVQYKGTVSRAEAEEVALATSWSDGYERWAEYDGMHVTVGCDELNAAYHDASYFDVDALTGSVDLLVANK